MESKSETSFVKEGDKSDHTLDANHLLRDERKSKDFTSSALAQPHTLMSSSSFPPTSSSSSSSSSVVVSSSSQQQQQQQLIARARPVNSPAISPPLFSDSKWIHFTAERSLSTPECPFDDTNSSPHGLTFKSNQGLTKVVKQMLYAHGFSETKGVAAAATVPNIVWSSSPITSDDIRHFEGHQRINHFVRIQSITRKDRLCENVQRMQLLKGFKHFDIIPKTFVLPQEMSQFRSEFDKVGGVWIIKPVALSRGRGISLINHPRQISVQEPTVISRYIEEPFCINGLKFDLRLYVLVTSFDPLRIYLFEEGLGRFASVPYRKSRGNIGNLSMHLTNYSFNKDHSDYIVSADPDKDNVGNKWSSSAIFRYLKDQGHDTDKILLSIEDVVIKTIIAGETPICSSQRSQPYHGNCFELLGFDILLDKNLRPWVLEVNLSPSLNCDTPLDLKIKSKLVADLFSLVGVSLPGQSSKGDSSRRRKAHTKHKTSDAYVKLRIGSKFEESSVLVQTKGEYRRKGGFVRIFPTSNTWRLYSFFLESRTKKNYLLHRNLYPENGRIIWPPSSSGTCLDVSARLKSLSIESTGRSFLKDNVSGYSPLQRIEIYMRKLHLDCDCSLLPTTGAEDSGGSMTEDTAMGRSATTTASMSKFQFESIVSIYLKKLSVYLTSMNFDKSISGRDLEKLTSSLTEFLKSASSLDIIIPEPYLPSSIRFRMILRQFKDFVSIHNNVDSENVSAKVQSSNITEIEEMILDHGLIEPISQNLTNLVKCNMCCRRKSSQTISSSDSVSAKKEVKHKANGNGKKCVERKCSEIVPRPHSVNSIAYPPSHLTGAVPRRSLETEDDAEEFRSCDMSYDRSCNFSYKSLPCIVQSGLVLDSELSSDTNRVILAALHRLSSRQSTRTE